MGKERDGGKRTIIIIIIRSEHEYDAHHDCESPRRLGTETKSKMDDER